MGRRYLLSHENFTILGFFQMLSQLTGHPAPRLRVPYPVALTFAHLEEWFSRHLSRRLPMATVGRSSSGTGV